MAIQVMQARQEPQQQQKEDPWDKVFKGLQIAGSVAGLAVDYQQFQQLRQQRELNDIKIGDAKNQQQGLVTPHQQAALAEKGFTFSSGDEGPMPQDAIQFKAPSGGNLYARAPGLEAPVETVSQKVQRDGKWWNVTTNKMTGEEVGAPVELGPIEQPAAQKPQVTTAEVVEDGVRYKVSYNPLDPTEIYGRVELGPVKDNASTDRKDTEYTSRIENIKANIGRLKAKIKDDGTYDVLGSHNQELDQAVQDIAVDYAKLVDPDSVARESEVESVKNMLKVTGMTTRNQTAQDALDNFLDQMETRINSKRIAQGMDPLPTTKEQNVGGDGTALAGGDLRKGKPGTQIKVNGKSYVVGDDGDTLIEIGQ